MTESAEFLHTIEKVWVPILGRLTVSVPEAALLFPPQAPEASQEVALVPAQVKVTEPLSSTSLEDVLKVKAIACVEPEIGAGVEPPPEPELAGTSEEPPPPPPPQETMRKSVKNNDLFLLNIFINSSMTSAIYIVTCVSIIT